MTATAPRDGPEQLCCVSSEAQLQAARRMQMRTFSSPMHSAPWCTPLARMYYAWDEEGETWKPCVGWLPRQLSDEVFLAGVFQDAENMTFWCEDHGKQKALTHGERKRVSCAVDALTGVIWPWVNTPCCRRAPPLCYKPLSRRLCFKPLSRRIAGAPPILLTGMLRNSKQADTLRFHEGECAKYRKKMRVQQAVNPEASIVQERGLGFKA